MVYNLLLRANAELAVTDNLKASFDNVLANAKASSSVRALSRTLNEKLCASCLGRSMSLAVSWFHVCFCNKLFSGVLAGRDG